MMRIFRATEEKSRHTEHENENETRNDPRLKENQARKNKNYRLVVVVVEEKSKKMRFFFRRKQL